MRFLVSFICNDLLVDAGLHCFVGMSYAKMEIKQFLKAVLSHVRAKGRMWQRAFGVVVAYLVISMAGVRIGSQR